MRRKLSVLAALLALNMVACQNQPTAAPVNDAQETPLAQIEASQTPSPTPAPTPTPEPPLSIKSLYEKTQLPFGTPSTLVYMRRGEPLPDQAPTPDPTATPKSKKKKSTPTPSPTPVSPTLKRQAAFAFNDLAIMPELNVSQQRLIVHSLPLSNSAPDGVAQLEYELTIEDGAAVSDAVLAAVTKLCRAEPIRVVTSDMPHSVNAIYYLNEFYVEFTLAPDEAEVEKGANIHDGPYLAQIRVFPADYEEAPVSEIMTEINDQPLPAQEELIDAWLSDNGIQLYNEPHHIVAAKGDPASKEKRVYHYPGADVLNVMPYEQAIAIDFNVGEEVVGVRFTGKVATVDGMTYEDGGKALVNRVTSICGFPSDSKQTGEGTSFAWEGFWRTTRFDVTFNIDPLAEAPGGFSYKLTVNPMKYVRSRK